MQIPKRLGYLLETDRELDGAVKLSINAFEPWFKHSHLPFFPEYTDHGIEHLEGVLTTAVVLIRHEAWEVLSAADAAVLTLSVLLHDCAMHLSEDGFFALLRQDRSSKSIQDLGDEDWLILWEEFLAEASRFDGRKLTSLFGDTEPVQRPPMDAIRFTKRDRLLIGEFLRRHHSRLAHEISEFGVPGSDNPLEVKGFAPDRRRLVDLAGLVARSHGADIRAFLPYLESHYDVRQFKACHPVFLMALVRVADYLQITADRAPSQVLQVKRLTSPVSQGEWKAHDAIKDIRHTDEDPEALFIDALPGDVHTFFRLKAWFDGIQQELDRSWALLGEVYGRYGELNQLGLTLRRVKSSIGNVKDFSKKVPYIPLRAAFRSSDADLLKLLIQPLYGDSPEVGIRELLQNAVDAVRELQQYRGDTKKQEAIAQPEQEGDVVISIDKVGSGDFVVTVSDKGIGMTPETVVDYFLKAGASFRKSDSWRKAFGTADGKSKLLRSGRFGIGSLATFLLGPQIKVTTRHIGEAQGVQFETDIESDAIELRKVNCPFGTTIEIRISAGVAKALEDSDWDWYCLSNPSVFRRSQGEILRQSHHLPDPNKELPPEWHRISHPDYLDIIWTYSEFPALTCNGISVRPRVSEKPENLFFVLGRPEADLVLPGARWHERYGLRLPNVAVFDSDGRLPLTLQRDRLSEEQYPFDSELAENVMRDFLAHALVFGTSEGGKVEFWRGPKYPGLIGGEGTEFDYYYTSEGLGYFDPLLLYEGGWKSLVVARLETGPLQKCFKQFLRGPSIASSASYSTIGSNQDWLRQMLECGIYMRTGKSSKLKARATRGEMLLGMMKKTGVRVLVPDVFWKRLTEVSKRLNKGLQKYLTTEWIQGGWRLVSSRNCPASNFDFRRVADSAPPLRIDSSQVAEFYLDFSTRPTGSPIARKWLEILKFAEIPYGLELRCKKLQHAFQELSHYVRAHETVKTFREQEAARREQEARARLTRRG